MTHDLNKFRNKLVELQNSAIDKCDVINFNGKIPHDYLIKYTVERTKVDVYTDIIKALDNSKVAK